MATNPSLNGRAAGRDVGGSVTGARRERDGGELLWFVMAIFIVAACFFLGYSERLPSGLKAERTVPDVVMSTAVASLRAPSASG